MFASLAADYPREPRTGEPDVLGEADRRLATGEIDAAGYRVVARDFARVLIAEQEVAGLAILSDGDVQNADRLQGNVAGLGGVSTDRVVKLPDGGSVRAPRFDRAPAWRDPITLDDWQWADGTTDLPVKQVVVGPYTIARLAEPGGAPREPLALGLAEAMNAELRSLAGAGCPIIQVDEGAVAAIGDDPGEWALYAATQERLTAGLEGHHLSLGIYHGAVDPAGYASVFDGPYRSYLVDGLAGPDAWRFVFAAPSDRGVIVGALDADQDVRDAPELMVWAMAWAAGGGRTADRIGVAPNGSLRSLGRHATRRKIEEMGEAVRIAAMGPLQEVAEALDPAPLESRIAPLRRLAEAVEAARTPR
jgi:5-methyltetrahydropteroyltriglutamate--homocysteine methyltransferase